MSNQYLSFDVTKQSTPQQLITGRQGDSQLKFVTMLFWDGDKNVPYDLTGKQVVFEALKPDNTHIVDYEGITVLDAPAGLVRYSFNEQAFSVAGTMQQAFFKITHTDSDNNVISDSTLEVAINILENRVEFGINSKDYLSEYDDLIAQVKKKFDDYAATVQDSINKAQALHDQIVEYTNLINSKGVILSSDFGDISSIKQPLGQTFVDKLNNEFNDRGVNVAWYGAKGDGVADDTKAIQAAIDSLGTTGGTILIPNGIYMIKADAPEQKAVTYLSDAGGISVPSNTTINLAPGAELKAIPTDEGAYNVIRLVGVHDVIISGGKITGERDLHTPKIGPSNTVGEWGYGIELQGSSNIVIRDISLTNFWGDGINIQAGVDEKTICQNVTIDNVACNNNRRQGMSIEALEHGLVCNSIFENTVGTAPACGLDLEPAYDVIVNNDILIENNQFLNNDNCGLLVTRANCNKQIKIKDNYFVGNSGKLMNAQLLAQLGDDILIENNDFLGNDNCYYGISVSQFNNVNVINNRLQDAGFINDGYLTNGLIDSNQFITTKLIKNTTFQLSDGSRNSTISNNIFNGLDMPAPTTDIPDIVTVYFRGTSLEIINNTLINQAFGIFATCDSSRIDGNHIHASHYAGIQSQGAATDIVNNVITGSCSLHDGGETLVITKTAIGNYVANNIIRKQSAVSYPDYFKSTSNPNGTVPGYAKTAIFIDNTDHSNPLYTTLNSNHVYGNIVPYYLSDSNFRDGLVFLSQVVGAGGAIARPSDAIIGSVFFDTTLGKPIFCKSDSANGNTQVWVDSTGTKV